MNLTVSLILQKTRIIIFLFLLPLLLCTSLPPEPDKNNIYDKNNPDYVPPEVSITTAPTDTVFIDQAAFTWQGNGNDDQYSFLLRGKNDIWSSWAASQTANFKYLDEEKYTFLVRSRYPNGDVALDSVEFVVNAVSGPSLIIKPKYVEAQQGDTITVSIAAEEVTDLMAVNIKISYSDQNMKIVMVEEALFLGITNGHTIFFDTVSTNTITISTGTTQGNPAGVSGSGNIARITFVLLSAAEADLTLDPVNCKIKTAGQETPDLNALVSGKIISQ